MNIEKKTVLKEFVGRVQDTAQSRFSDNLQFSLSINQECTVLMYLITN